MAQDSYFPSTKREALALLYVQQQNLSEKSPEEIAAMYENAYSRIDSAISDIQKAKKEQKRSRNLSMV